MGIGFQGLPEHSRHVTSLDESTGGPIAMVMKRLEWFVHGKSIRRDETQNTRAVVDMKMEKKRLR